jgi:hypothetical protein
VATNAYGSGPASAASNSVTPAAPPYIEEVFSTYLYTGTGAALTITNGIDLSGKGGLVWSKRRSGAESHVLLDTARNNGSSYLASDDTGAQATAGNFIQSFNSNGYSIGSNNLFNLSGSTNVSWTFGEQAKFFDVVTYTGNGTSGRTISHNLGSTPGMIIVKSSSVASVWAVYHRSLTGTNWVRLNTTDASVANSTIWNDTNPTSTEFTVGNSANTNQNTSTYVAYLFAHNAGGFGASGTDNVISCGSFTTDGSGNATVSLGYEPQWVIVKNTSSNVTGGWNIIDNMRGWTTINGSALFSNVTDAEITSSLPELTSTGFNWTFGNAAFASTDYIYIAIRRGPMKVPTVGTSVFTPILTGSGATLSDSYSAIGFPIDMTLRYQTGTDTDGAFKNAVYTRLMGINSGATDTPTSANNPNLLTHSTAAQIATYYYSQTGSMGLDYGGSWAAPAYVLAHMHFKRAPSFFDVVCYTGTGVARTIAHNLGVVPQLMIIKDRTPGGNEWAVYVSPLGNQSALSLNRNYAAGPSTIWNNTTPTSSVFSVSDAGDVNGSGYTLVAYLFATCAGVSKVGSYTGTGTTQTINCGFTTGSRYVLIKRTDSTSGWYVWDSARGITAGNDPYLLLNNTAAEVTNTDYIDTAATGFEISSTAPDDINASGGTYIFLAIA